MRPEPLYPKEKNKCYVEINGKHEPLGKHPEDAPQPIKGKNGWDTPPSITAAFHKLMATDPAAIPEAKDILVAQLCDMFLEFSSKRKIGA